MLLGALAALPSMLLAYMDPFAFRATMFLGHWPYYGHPDPKDLPEQFHPQSEFLELLMPVMMSATLTSLFTSVVLRFARTSRAIPDAMGAALVLGAFSIVLLILDPAGVLEWIVD